MYFGDVDETQKRIRQLLHGGEAPLVELFEYMRKAIKNQNGPWNAARHTCKSCGHTAILYTQNTIQLNALFCAAIQQHSQLESLSYHHSISSTNHALTPCRLLCFRICIPSSASKSDSVMIFKRITMHL